MSFAAAPTERIVMLRNAFGRLRPVETVLTACDGSHTVAWEGAISPFPNHAVTFGPAVAEWLQSDKKLLCGPLAAYSTLVVFDFDFTLTVKSMHQTLRSPDGQRRLNDNLHNFYVGEIFGGAERLGRLRAFLRQLQDTGVTIVLLANGVGKEIEAALLATGLRHCFWKCMVREDHQTATEVGSKAEILAQLCLQAKGEFAQVLFVDEDRDNFPKLESIPGCAPTVPQPGTTWRLAAIGDAHLPFSVVTLVAWPVGKASEGSGIGSSDMDAIIELFEKDISQKSHRPVPPAAFDHVDDPTRAYEVVSAVQPCMKLPTIRFTDPGAKAAGAVRFVCISDTHGRTMSQPLPPGDVLLHAGDFSNTGRPQELTSFRDWLMKQPHRRKVVIAGNHDLTMDDSSYAQTYSRFGHPKMYDTVSCRATIDQADGVEYLCDSATVIDGVVVYGSPWQPAFAGWAFAFPAANPEFKNFGSGGDEQVPSLKEVHSVSTYPEFAH